MSDAATSPNHHRIVIDVDVLAADLFCGGSARESLDIIRSHSWLELVVTEPLLSEAQTVITRIGSTDLAEMWIAKIHNWDQVRIVEQPTGDHPALAAAYRGKAPHIITMDSRLQSVRVGTQLQSKFPVSIRSPDAFIRVYEPAAIYPLLFDDGYSGPDQDPRQ